MLIAYILAILIAISVFFYMGLNLSSNLELDSMQYYLFWAAYIIFGLSLANVLFLGKVWQIIQAKRGPVGARGYRGDIGSVGNKGECFMEQFIIAIKRETMLKIVDTLISEDIVSDANKVYDPSRLKLVNRYLDMRFQRQLDSAQMYALMESGIKTTNEMASYIAGLWSQWIYGMISAVGDTSEVKLLFTNPTEVPSEAIDKYIMEEVSRSDVWNWGHNVVVRRPVVKVRAYKSWQSQIEQGNRHPGAPLKFHLVSYSDRDLAALKAEPLWSSSGYPDAVMLNISKTNLKLLNNNNEIRTGIRGTIRRPAIYIPKTWRDPETNEKYFPLGVVMVETNPEMKSAVTRYALLVSGDIITPNVVKGPIWHDTTGKTNKGAFFSLASNKAGYAMLSSAWITTGKAHVNMAKKDLGLNYGSNNPTNLDNWEGPVAVPNIFLDKIEGVTWPVEVWNYRPPPMPKNAKARMKYLIDYGAPSRYNVRLMSMLPLDSKNMDMDAGADVDINIGLSGMINITNLNINSEVSPSRYVFKDWVLQMGLSRNHLGLIGMDPLPVIGSKDIIKAKPETNNIGLAWYGEPHRDSKYSVFAFLGIVPEGQLKHIVSGRTVRFEHYGGPEPELYNIIVIQPTMKHVINQDRKEYLIGIEKTGKAIQFVTRDSAAEEPSRVQWEIRSVDPISKRIKPLDVSHSSHNDVNSNVNDNEFKDGQIIALESVGRPGNVIGISDKLSLAKNRWSSTNANDLASLRPSGIKLDGIYMEWSLIGNAIKAGPMSTFMLQPAA